MSGIKRAPAIGGKGYIYDSNNNLVYKHTNVSGGDSPAAVTLSGNAITAVYDGTYSYLVPAGDPEINTQSIVITYDGSTKNNNFTLPYAPKQITFTSGMGETPLTVAQGETKEATAANGAISSGAGFEIHYSEEQGFINE